MEQARNIESDSDHDLIVVKLKIKGRVHNSENTYTIKYTNLNKNDFLNELYGLKWTNIYNEDEPTIIADMITNN